MNWCNPNGHRHIFPIDILRPDVDNSGYDLVLQCGAVSRYIQIKSSKKGAKTSQQTVNANLADKLGGCIIWMFQDDSCDSVNLTYRFFGGCPSEHPYLGNKTGKRNKGNAQGEKAARPDTRVVSKGRFDKPVCIAGLFDKLFPDVAVE